jgi:hypothetical protein
LPAIPVNYILYHRRGKGEHKFIVTAFRDAKPVVGCAQHPDIHQEVWTTFMTILNTFASSLSAHPPRSTYSTLIRYLKEFAKTASMTEISPNGRIASITQMFLLFLNFLIERFYASFSARHASSIVPKQRISYMRLNLHQSIRASVICYFS